MNSIRRGLRAVLFCSFVMAFVGCAPGRKAGPAAGMSTGIVHGHLLAETTPLANSVVALVAQRDDGQALCTGTLLANDLVLTAAHCVDHDPQGIVVVFAAKLKGVQLEQTRRVLKYAQNPRWKQTHPETDRGDLALVEFAGGVPEGFAPVKLAPKELKLSEGEDVTMAGYGVTNAETHKGSGTLRMTKTKVAGSRGQTEIISDGRKTSVCFGDSGGPAFVQDGTELVQWGVASAVSSDGCDAAIVHTELMPYEAWLTTTAQRLRAATASATKGEEKSGFALK